MESYNDIKDDIYKCSKCGLCKYVCPVYIATKNEMYSPRGRFIILNNFFNNKKPLTKNFINNLDLCLHCNLCQNFCPSNIDSNKIITEIKYKNKIGIFNIYFKIILLIYFLFQPFQKKITKRFKLIPNSVNTKFQDKERERNFGVAFLKGEQIYGCDTRLNNNEDQIVYFEGCYNKYINPSDKNASLNLIEGNGGKIIQIISQCCGYPLLSDGDIDKFKKNANKIIKSIPKNCKYIICSCDSCLHTLKQFGIYINNSENFTNKLITLDQFLEIKHLNINEIYNTDIVYHKPLLKENECYLPKEIKIINKKGSATLAENFFLFKHPILYKQLLKQIFYNKEEIEGKTIITTCQISKIGLEIGVKRKNINAKILSYSEYIENGEISKK